MDWKNFLFSFGGRINRAKFWLFVLISFLVSIVASIVQVALVSVAGAEAGIVVYTVITLALTVFSIWAGLAVGVKRLHDRKKSGWWLALFYLAPGILIGLAWAMAPEGAMTVPMLAAGAIWIWSIIELGCLKGTTGANMYGPDPLPAEPV